MQYERIILELLSRINTLEEKVAVLEMGEIRPIGSYEKRIDANALPPPSKKYRLLSDYLYNSEHSRISLSFGDLEQILGFELPPSAYKYREFWANTKSHSIALSWLGVGFETVEVDVRKKLIVFEQKRQYEEQKL